MRIFWMRSLSVFFVLTVATLVNASLANAQCFRGIDDSPLLISPQGVVEINPLPAHSNQATFQYHSGGKTPPPDLNSIAYLKHLYTLTVRWDKNFRIIDAEKQFDPHWIQYQRETKMQRPVTERITYAYDVSLNQECPLHRITLHQITNEGLLQNAIFYDREACAELMPLTDFDPYVNPYNPKPMFAALSKISQRFRDIGLNFILDEQETNGVIQSMDIIENCRWPIQ